MQGLLSKEDIRRYFGLKTIEATEKLLRRLDVPKMDFSIIGGKGVRYRKSDLDEALAKIEVKPLVAKKQRNRKRQKITDIFDLSIKDQMKILTADVPRQ